jgi:hypothetical protein
MAVHKATRSKSLAQPQPERHMDHQLKAEVFETIRHLNRGYGVALAALDKLEKKDRSPGLRIFSIGFLRDFHNRTEALRAEVNRDLLRLIAGHEDADTLRFRKRQ